MKKLTVSIKELTGRFFGDTWTETKHWEKLFDETKLYQFSLGNKDIKIDISVEEV